MKHTLYCGSYGNEGIYKVEVENGKFSAPQLFSRIEGTKYLCVDGEHIVSVYSEGKGKSGVAVLDLKGNKLASLIHEDILSCFVSSQSGNICTANYHEGTFSFLKYENGDITLKKKVFIKEEAGCHMVFAFKEYYLGFALFMDAVYVFDSDYEYVQKIHFPKGSGPRHGVLSADGKYLYVVSELSNEVFVVSTADWTILNQVQLTKEKTDGSAAIRLFGDKLYVSIRGLDEVYELRVNNNQLEVLSSYSCGGKHPRDMIVLDGQVICANTHSSTLTLLREGKVVDSVEIPEAVTVDWTIL